ncbi:MAG TPA: TlpA disulfide reductase family protein [Puia sp.]|uniref:TlpA disulfide reductase family protein n=1 Tax=Puia sp. TaxID=2045100 RepID=UPI002CEE24B0|nr:TlpA disulfide reductase family protein [Puia sp.]HVU99275.1 TlpA disulfide reductase family protein [Puia sp.]
MNLLAFVALALFALPDSTYTINGTIEGLDQGWVFLMHHGATPKTDSVRARNGQFSFSGTVSEPELCTLALKGNDGQKHNGPYFFLGGGKLTLAGKMNAFSSAFIGGTPIQEEYRQLDSSEAKLADDERQKQAAKAFVQTHPASYVSAFALLNYFSYNPNERELDSLVSGLDPRVRTSYLGQLVNEVLRGAKLTAIGNAAPAFTQNDVDGKAVALSSFRGKYVLVDFWASWCGPCRQENPNVVKAYRQYHAKGFTIVGVSLDDQKDRWVAAIKKDGLAWTQVSDLKGWDNQVASLYGIKGIPMNFLLDKNGSIIAKGLTGEALEKKLAELLP